MFLFFRGLLLFAILIVDLTDYTNEGGTASLKEAILFVLKIKYHNHIVMYII